MVHTRAKKLLPFAMTSMFEEWELYCVAMFTGLIQDLGTVTSVGRGAGPMRLAVRPDSMRVEDLEPGESIAVSGPCLTVVDVSGGVVSFDVGAESLARTTVTSWRSGRRVNLERALRLGDRLGGHLVLGHVDDLGEVRERTVESGVLQLVITLSEEIAPLVCEKGSIAVDGVSLTVNDVWDDGFRITLIPETLERTTLGSLERGDSVNLEADILARHIARLLARAGQGGADEPSLDLEFLARSGYL